MPGKPDLHELFEASGSSGVAVVAEGEVVLAVGQDRPVLVQSVTKLVVALGAGIALSSLGNPVEVAARPLGDIFDEWAGDERAAITITSLLGHRSGLVPVAPHELESSPDALQLALSSPYDPVGAARFTYNNAGPFVVAAAIERLTSRPVDDWLRAELFEQLGCDASWDRGPNGSIRFHGGLVTTARSLALIGDAARTATRIPGEWVAHLVSTASSAYSQPAWVEQKVVPRIVREWRDGGIDPELLKALGDMPEEGLTLQEILALMPHQNVSALFAVIAAKGLPRAETRTGPMVGWGHDGDGGQWLVVAADRGVAAAHTRGSDAYDRPPEFFPPGAVLAALDAHG